MSNSLIASVSEIQILPLEKDSNKIAILIASMALGGAEKIVLDWALAEAKRGRCVEIAVLYRVSKEWSVPKEIDFIARPSSTSVNEFLSQLSDRWKKIDSCISTHLIRDNILEILWKNGIATTPVFHNSKAGWKNTPDNWEVKNVPMIIGCADSVSREIEADTNNIPIRSIKHQPYVSKQAIDTDTRNTIRRKLKVSDDELMVGAIGSLKAQKNYTRAIRIIAEVNKVRSAVLCIFGGIQTKTDLDELNKIIREAQKYNVVNKVRLVGFVSSIEKYYSAIDAVLNTRHFEGYSIATQEALCAGIPVVGTAVSGQLEANDEQLTLICPSQPDTAFSSELIKKPIRQNLLLNNKKRISRLWTLPTRWKPKKDENAIETLFLTANLNAGGAQRSLVNLALALAETDAEFAVGVCNKASSPYFSTLLKENRVKAFLACDVNDIVDITASLLMNISGRNVQRVCFWNMDPKVKLLLAKFLPESVALFDISPGGYAFDEMEQTKEFQSIINFDSEEYYERLNTLILKYHNDMSTFPYNVDHKVIENGVQEINNKQYVLKPLKFLVSGRIAQSKHLDIIIEAFRGFINAGYEAQLDIVGQAEDRNIDYLKSIKDLAKDLPINFLGSKQDLSYLNDDYSATIVLGTHQGCPNAILESMSASIPVIANDSGGTRELVKPNLTGYLMPSEPCADKLLEAMIQFVNNPELNRSLVMRGKALINSKYLMEVMRNKYYSLLFTEKEHTTIQRSTSNT
jgi:glycosyltransferase involved in cell wall biosynthesis